MRKFLIPLLLASAALAPAAAYADDGGSHRGARSLVVGTGGIDLEAFLAAHPREWLDG